MGAHVTRFSGAILAGGSAARFDGAPKGLELVGGRRIIDRVADALADGESPLLVVTSQRHAPQTPGTTELHRSRAQGAPWGLDAHVCSDVLAGGGAAAGVHAALRAASGPVVAIAWDMPFVTRALVRSICEYAVPEWDAVVVEGNAPGRLEPLCAWYAEPCADAIEEIWGKTRSLHDALARVRTRIVPRTALAQCGDPDILFFNVNTAEDLARARACAVG